MNDGTWQGDSLSAVKKVARKSKTFTTDEVWPLVDYPVEPRIMGSLMRMAEVEGIASPTNRFVISERPECHSRPVRVWKSLVFKGA